MEQISPLPSHFDGKNDAQRIKDLIKTVNQIISKLKEMEEDIGTIKKKLNIL